MRNVTPEVAADGGVPLLGSDLGGGPGGWAAAPDERPEHVGRPVGALGLRPQALQRGWICDIAGDPGRLAAVPADFGRLSLSAAGSRPFTTTLAPLAASRRQVAAPMPWGLR